MHTSYTILACSDTSSCSTGPRQELVIFQFLVSSSLGYMILGMLKA
jgi:hypothetical protein